MWRVCHISSKNDKKNGGSYFRISNFISSAKKPVFSIAQIFISCSFLFYFYSFQKLSFNGLVIQSGKYFYRNSLNYYAVRINIQKMERLHRSSLKSKAFLTQGTVNFLSWVPGLFTNTIITFFLSSRSYFIIGHVKQI